MTIFEFYGIPETLSPDPHIVRQKYLELSRRFHPDINQDASATDDLLTLSALNNEAYKIFQQFDLLLQYVLQQRGLLESGEQQQLPPDFLMEMMELNEAIQEAGAEERSVLAAQVEQLSAELKSAMQALAATFTDATEARKQELALELKELYHKNKYLLRLRESIDKFAAL